MRQDPHSVFGYISKDIDIIVKTNTKETIYMVITNLDNNNIQELTHISAAGSASSVGTVASAGTFATLTCPATVGTFSSLGTAGSAGSAG